MATIYEVSKLAGVSLATVSRVMNKNANVSEKTRQKVNKAIEQLDYRPNSIAQSLASSCSNCVGVLVAELDSPFYGSMMGGIESVLRAAHKHIVVTAGRLDEKREQEEIEFLISRNCDALILHVEAVSDAYLINISKNRTPIVILNRHIPEIADSCITLDNELGGYLATKAALETGHRKVAYISGPQGKGDAIRRLEGHKRALREFDIEDTDDRIFTGDFLQNGGRQGVAWFLDKGIEFTSVICANDEMASGAMFEVRERGLEVPYDVSVVGFDNILFASYTYPKLTTVNYPTKDMGGMAAKLVLKQVYKECEDDITTRFEPQLVERHSVARPKQ